LLGWDDAKGKSRLSMDLVCTIGDIVTRSFFRSGAAELSIFAEFNGGDEGVRVRVMIAVVVDTGSLWWVFDEFEHLKISRNSRRNRDDVAE